MCQTQSGYDRCTPTRFVLDKKEERKTHPLVDHASSVRPFRPNNEFSRKRLSGANRYFVLALPFARAILSYKRSRTIELPVHHRFHLPRTSLLHRAIRSTLGRVDTSHFSRIAHAIYIVLAGLVTCVRERSAIGKPLYVRHASHRRSGKDKGDKRWPSRRHGRIGRRSVGGTLKSQRHTRDIYHNSRRSTYFSLEARGTGTSSLSLSLSQSLPPSLSLSLFLSFFLFRRSVLVLPAESG